MAITYFSATDATHGNELWKTDGTPGGTVLVADINPGVASSFPFNFDLANGTLYFVANDGNNGSALWKSDGTAAGTVLVMDLVPGNSGFAPPLISIGNTLYFRADDGTSGIELWKTSGGAPTRVTDFNAPVSDNFGPQNLTVLNGELYFTANDGTTGRELWKTDGTTVTQVADIVSGPGSSSPDSIVNVNGTLFFIATDPVNGEELWKSDGTGPGTVRVADLEPGPGNPFITGLTAVGGTLFFFASVGASGQELWKSDGTAAGTGMVADINPGSGSSAPNAQLIDVNGTAYFVANDGVHGFELWKSDGTAAGTVMVKDINPGSGNGLDPSLEYFANVNGTLYFTAFDQAHGFELWKTDGTADGTVVIDIVPGTASSSPLNLTNVDGTLYFAATDPLHGQEAWKSDGTAAGTVRIADINTSVADHGSSSVGAVIGSAEFFAAFDPSTGIELWKTDGVTTTLVKDINPGVGNGMLGDPININGTLFFAADDGAHGTELWKSDGTAAGTVMVRDIALGSGSSTPQLFKNINGTLYFSADDGPDGRELWKSDGTAAGTVLVKNINTTTSFDPSSNAQGFTALNGTMFFTANEGGQDFELWKTDGTEGGTVRVQDLFPGPDGSSPFALTSFNGALYFAATDSIADGVQLWKSDGTNNAVLVKDSNGNPISNPNNLTLSNGILYFSANDATTGVELWKTDGTSPGTVMLADINPGSGGSSPGFLTDVNGTLFFEVFGPTNALWKSNGTPGGTVIVKDFGPLTSPIPFIQFPTNVNGTLYFTFTDSTHGRELWKSDGTDAGTVVVADINPGSGSSNPSTLTNVNGTLYFTAYDPVNGRQEYKTDGTAAGTVKLSAFDVSTGNALITTAIGQNNPGFIALPNIAPVITASSGTTAANEQIAAIIDSGVTVSDADNSSLASATVSITGGFHAAEDVLAFSNNGSSMGNIAASYNGAAGILTLTSAGATATLAQWQAALRAVTYTDTSDAPSTSNRTISFQVFDGGDSSAASAKTISVTALNDAPTNIALSKLSIPENSANGTVVGGLSDTDPDSGDTAAFTLIDNAGGRFAVSGSNLVVANGGLLDFESATSHSVTVRVTDSGGLHFDKTFGIGVTNVNEAPTNIGLSNASVGENSANGTVVGALIGADPDAGDTATFTLVDNAGGRFGISGNNLIVADGSRLDFESNSTHSVTVRVTDSGGLTLDKVFAIGVTNVNEAPTDIGLSGSSVAENSVNGTVVGALIGTDPDAGDTAAFTLLDDAGGRFAINGSNLVVADGGKLDFETNSSHSVTVRVTDSGGLTLDKTFNIAVTDVSEAGPSGPPHWMKSVFIPAHPAGWSPAQIGDFTGDGTSDLAWYNASTGNLDIWKLQDGGWSASTNLGSHPAGYQLAGNGDLNHDGTSDLVWFNPTTRDVDLWKMSDGKWAGSVDIGTHPAGYAPSAVGDFTGDGSGDIAWYNASTNDIDIWKIVDGHWAGSTSLGAHPAGYQPVLTGDFNGDGTSDIAWYNPATGDIDIWKMTNGQWAGSVGVGPHPAGWQPLGAADYNRDGTSDIVWYNPATNNIDVWLMKNGQWSASVDVGTHPAGAVAVGVGDFDHNGVSDIMWRDTTGFIDNWLLTTS